MRATDAPPLDKNKDVDFGWSLLEIITFISVISSVEWQEIHIVNEIVGNLDIKSIFKIFLE